MKINAEDVQTLYDTRFLHLYDLQYAPGKHYFEVSRRKEADLVAVQEPDAFQRMLPDAVTLCVILQTEEGDRLLTFYEYRYPVGRFLLSPPAGLLDAEDLAFEDAIYRTSVRELYEETGIRFREGEDVFQIMNPALFSSPGMTDESNAAALLVIRHPDLSSLTDAHATGSEQFRGFQLLSREDAMTCIRSGRDPHGNMYSVFTWQALLYFVSDLWKSYI